MRYALDRRVALITGAARGIGASIAVHLAKQGCFVVVGDVDTVAAAALAAEIGPSATSVDLDVRHGDSVGAAVRAAVRRDGGIDILINNAGVLCTGPFDQATEQEWQHMLEVNITGVFHCIRAAVPAMADRQGASIVNISSTSAERGGGVFGNVWYGATKAAVIAMTKGLARELGPRGIRVNAIAPGVVHTGMAAKLLTDEMRDSVKRRSPLGQLVTAEDIARCAAFLASDDARLVTGATMTVDAGYSQT